MNEHLALLWCIVVIGASYIVYTLLASLYQYLRPSPLDLPASLLCSIFDASHYRLGITLYSAVHKDLLVFAIGGTFLS